MIFGFAGFVIGMFLMALMCAAGRADEESERMVRDEELRDYQRRAIAMNTVSKTVSVPKGFGKAEGLRELAERASLN